MRTTYRMAHRFKSGAARLAAAVTGGCRARAAARGRVSPGERGWGDQRIRGEALPTERPKGPYAARNKAIHYLRRGGGAGDAPLINIPCPSAFMMNTVASAKAHSKRPRGVSSLAFN